MALLDSPQDPDDVWQALGDDVPPHRLLMQGDVILAEGEPLLVVTHACSMRRGSALHETQMVAPIQEQHVSSWNGSYDWMPLRGAPVPGISNPAGALRVLRSVGTDELLSGERVAVMSDQGSTPATAPRSPPDPGRHSDRRARGALRPDPRRGGTSRGLGPGSGRRKRE